MAGLRKDELAVLSAASVSALACLATGTGFTFFGIFLAYAQFLALQYMLIFTVSRYAYGWQRDGAHGRGLLSRIAGYGSDEALRATDYELARGGLALLVALTAYTNIKVRVPIFNDAIHDATLAAFDRIFSADNFHSFAQRIQSSPTLDTLFQQVYLQDYLFVAAAALLLHLRGEARAVRMFFAASSFVYLFGIWVSALWPTFGPCFVDAPHWASLQGHPIGKFQGTLARDMLRTLKAASEHAPVVARAFSGVAAFPSLHVGHMAVVAFICGRTPNARWYAAITWLGIALTSVATVAFGWHYLADTFGGVAVAALSVWLAARLGAERQTHVLGIE